MGVEQHDLTNIEIGLPFHRTWQLRSKMENFEAYKRAFAEILRQLGLSDDETFALQYGFDEIVVNAIKHGNKEDPEKSLEINFDVDPEQAVLRVRDQGQGFVREQVPDATDPNNLLKTTGRGLMTTEQLMDEVIYNGPVVKMVKKLRRKEK